MPLVRPISAPGASIHTREGTTVHKRSVDVSVAVGIAISALETSSLRLFQASMESLSSIRFNLDGKYIVVDNTPNFIDIIRSALQASGHELVVEKKELYTLLTRHEFCHVETKWSKDGKAALAAALAE